MDTPDNQNNQPRETFEVIKPAEIQLDEIEQRQVKFIRTIYPNSFLVNKLEKQYALTLGCQIYFSDYLHLRTSYQNLLETDAIRSSIQKESIDPFESFYLQPEQIEQAKELKLLGSNVTQISRRSSDPISVVFGSTTLFGDSTSIPIAQAIHSDITIIGNVEYNTVKIYGCKRITKSKLEDAINAGSNYIVFTDEDELIAANQITSLLNSTLSRKPDEYVGLSSEKFELTQNFLDLLKLAVNKIVRFDPMLDGLIGFIPQNHEYNLNVKGLSAYKNYQSEFKMNQSIILEKLQDLTDKLNPREAILYNQIIKTLIPLFQTLQFIQYSYVQDNLEFMQSQLSARGYSLDNFSKRLEGYYSKLLRLLLQNGLNQNIIFTSDEIRFLNEIL